MRPLPGDESVDALLGRLLDIRASPTADNADLAGNDRSPGRKMHMSSHQILDPGVKNLAIDLIHHTEPDGRAEMLQKGNPITLQIQSVTDQNIIPHARMGIQREMGAVDGESILDGETQFAVARPGDRLQAAPEEAMMNKEKIGAGFHGHGDGGLTGIHSRDDLGDFPFIFHLQAIHGIRVITDLIDTEDAVEVLNEIYQFHS